LKQTAAAPIHDTAASAGTHVEVIPVMTTHIPTVRDVMTSSAATLNVSDHLDLARDIMTIGRIRHLPVVLDGRVVGIVSQRDLFRAAISSALKADPAAQLEWLSKIPICDVMSKPVYTAQANWPLRRAVNLMLEKRIGCLPVVGDGTLIGLLSESDCLRLLAEQLGRDDPASVEHHEAVQP
jgi:CBS domain-containing protein